MPSRGRKNRKYKARKLVRKYRGIVITFQKPPSMWLMEQARKEADEMIALINARKSSV